MNAFKKYTAPSSCDPTDWAQSVQEHCESLQGADGAHGEVRSLLAAVQAAVRSGQVSFIKGNVAEAVEFANWVLEAAQTVDPAMTGWHCPQLCPPSVALFVQPDESGRFSFQPMFTL